MNSQGMWKIIRWSPESIVDSHVDSHIDQMEVSLKLAMNSEEAG